jgi:hypothetical protein
MNKLLRNYFREHYNKILLILFSLLVLSHIVSYVLSKQTQVRLEEITSQLKLAEETITKYKVLYRDVQEKNSIYKVTQAEMRKKIDSYKGKMCVDPTTVQIIKNIPFISLQ